MIETVELAEAAGRLRDRRLGLIHEDDEVARPPLLPEDFKGLISLDQFRQILQVRAGAEP